MAWFAIRMYHPPMSVADGWAWSPRSQASAFGIGMGVGSFAGLDRKGRNNADVERGVAGAPVDESHELGDLQRHNTADDSGSSARHLRSI